MGRYWFQERVLSCFASQILSQQAKKHLREQNASMKNSRSNSNPIVLPSSIFIAIGLQER